MRKSRLAALLLIISMMMLAAACGAQESSEPSEAEETKQTYDPCPIVAEQGEQPNYKVADGTFEFSKGGMTFRVPDCFGELPESSGEANRNARTTRFYAAIGMDMGMLEFTAIENFTPVSDEDFDNYQQVFLSTNAESLKNSDGVSDFNEAYSKEFLLKNGQKAGVSFCTLKLNGVAIESWSVLINDPIDNTMLLVALFQTAEAEYDYAQCFEKMVMDGIIG